MLTLCFFKVILNKFFLQKTVVYSKFTSCSGCKFLGFFRPKYFHVLHLSSALSATCSRKKSGKGFLSKFGGFSALRPAIRANAHLNAALEMLRENRTFSARKCTRRCSSGGCGLSVQLTVYDLFTEAMSDAGLRYIGAESNYVSTIYAPYCLGGYALSEFTNGKKSGWMYTVNGTHPNQGLKNWTLNDNDVVVWHYVNDYSHEVADWFNDPNYPSLGNGT